MPEGFEYWQSSNDSMWYFHLKSPNNEIIAHSEGYATMQNCLDGINTVKNYAPNAAINEKTQE